MPQTLHCPHCHGVLAVADEDAGFRLTCPHCSKDFVAPARSAANETSSANPSTDQDDWLSLESPTANNTNTANTDSKASSFHAATPEQSVVAHNNAAAEDDFMSSTESLPASGASSADDNLFSGLPEFSASANPPAIGNRATSGVSAAGPPASTAPSPSTAPAAPRQEPEFAKEYRVKCPICGTATYAKDHQAGKNIQCVDCHTAIKVPPPPRVKKKPEMTPIDQVQAIPMQKAIEVDRPQSPFQKSAAELLEAAEADHRSDPKTVDRSDMPDIKDWAISVFGIFRDPGVIAHFLVLSAIAAAACYIAALGAHPILLVGVFLIVGLCFVGVLGCGFAILESVANAQKRVHQWPVFDPIDWFVPTITVAAAAGLVLAPVNAVAGVLLGGAPLIVLAANFLMFYALFPFVLLSMLDMGTIFAPFSPEVSRSINKCQEAWGGFYFSSGVLFFASFLVIIVLVSGGAPSGVVLAVFLVTGLLFTYFSMLGRLAYAVGQAVNAPARAPQAEAANKDSEK